MDEYLNLEGALPDQILETKVRQGEGYRHFTADVISAAFPAGTVQLSFFSLRQKYVSQKYQIVGLPDDQRGLQAQGLVGGLEVVEEGAVRMSPEIAKNTAVLILKNLKESKTLKPEEIRKFVEDMLAENS